MLSAEQPDRSLQSGGERNSNLRNSETRSTEDAESEDLWWLDVVRCPVTGEALQPADCELLQRLQQQQREGTLKNRLGIAVSESFSAGLTNVSRQWFYPITNGIPSLLGSEAIALKEA